MMRRILTGRTHRPNCHPEQQRRTPAACWVSRTRQTRGVLRPKDGLRMTVLAMVDINDIRVEFLQSTANGLRITGPVLTNCKVPPSWLLPKASARGTRLILVGSAALDQVHDVGQ